MAQSVFLEFKLEKSFLCFQLSMTILRKHEKDIARSSCAQCDPSTGAFDWWWKDGRAKMWEVFLRFYHKQYLTSRFLLTSQDSSCQEDPEYSLIMSSRADRWRKARESILVRRWNWKSAVQPETGRFYAIYRRHQGLSLLASLQLTILWFFCVPPTAHSLICAPRVRDPNGNLFVGSGSGFTGSNFGRRSSCSCSWTIRSTCHELGALHKLFASTPESDLVHCHCQIYS
jgi:hypothetical protein